MQCHACIHRRSLAGNTHSRCGHPVAADSVAEDFLLGLLGFSELATAARTLGITINPHGAEMGWANWPVDFDPIWINTCSGFTPPDVKVEKNIMLQDPDDLHKEF